MDLGYYYSAPSSPTHFLVLNAASPSAAASGGSSSLDFDFSVTFPPTETSSADELFCNGRIRPAKLSPNSLEPMIESDDAVAGERHQTPPRGGRSPRGSLRQRSRSMSSLRSASGEESEETEGKGSDETTSCATGRRSRRWLFLMELLYRSKSEGRGNEGHNSKYSNTKRKTERINSGTGGEAVNEEPGKKSAAVNKNSNSNNRKTGDGKKRGPAPTPSALRSASAHELHYTAKRAQTEEMRKKTFLPYKQGLLGCLGFRFSCKSFGAIDDFAGALCSR